MTTPKIYTDQGKMDLTDSSSDYSDDFEEYESSKTLLNGSSKPPEVLNTPSRAPLAQPDPSQRRTQSKPVVRKHVKNWRQGVRALSERPPAKPRWTPFSPRDRELSAKLHTIKKLQNKLADCQRELTDSKKENKLLNRLQARQERELNRVATQEGELPQILARHSEEIRVLKEQLKRSQESTITHQEKVYTLNSEIQRLRDRGKKYEQVAKRKNLLERETLTLQLQEANEQIQEQDRKLKEFERRMDILNKTHSQEIKSLLVKNKALSNNAEASKEQADRTLAQLKDRAKEMSVMNIYSQRLGRNTLNSSNHTEIDSLLTEDSFSQTDITCPPNKNVSMQTKPTLKSSSSQTQTTPTKTLDTRTTQTDIPIEMEETKAPMLTTQQTKSSLSAVQTSQPPVRVTSAPKVPQEVTKLPSPLEMIESPPPIRPMVSEAVNDEEQQRKNLLLSRLRALDSQKGPPASQPIAVISHKITAENIGPATSNDVGPPTNNPQSTTAHTLLAQPIVTQSSVKIPTPGAIDTPQTSAQEEEARKKKLLLAKLMAIDEGSDPKNITPSKMNVTSESVPNPNVIDHSGQSSSSLQSWQADTVSNLHKGKPAFFTEDDPFGSRKSSGKRSAGIVKSKSSAKASSDMTNIFGTQGYKPTFGRRAKGTAKDSSMNFFNSEFVNKDRDKAVSTNIFGTSFNQEQKSTSKEQPFGLYKSEPTEKPTGQDYPWEKRVNLASQDTSLLQGPGNMSMVFGPMSNAPLLPRRPKAEANRLDTMPGSLAEPDDLEELVL